MRHELMDFMFADPTMLDDLEYLFKSDMARSLLFFYQATNSALRIRNDFVSDPDLATIF